VKAVAAVAVDGDTAAVVAVDEVAGVVDGGTAAEVAVDAIEGIAVAVATAAGKFFFRVISLSWDSFLSQP
jgi:hypothetical protein